MKVIMRKTSINKLDLEIRTLLDRVIDEPEDPKAMIMLGYALYQKKLSLAAIAAYEQAIKLVPSNNDAHFYLGIALAETGETDKAIAEFIKASILEPNDADNHYNLGNAYSEKGLLDQAIEEYQIAIKLNDGLVDAYYNMGFRPNFVQTLVGGPDPGTLGAIGRGVGPSGKPKIHMDDSNTKKEAFEKAKRASAPGQDPIHHANPIVGDPHYHAVNAAGRKIEDGVHYTYPR